MTVKYMRLLLSACGCAWLLAVSPSSQAQSESSESSAAVAEEVASWWSFDDDSGSLVLDAAERKEDPVHGPVEYVPGVRGKAVKLDGFRTHVRRESHNAARPAGAFTVES